MLKALEERIIQISDRDYEAKPFSLEHLLVMASRLYGWGVGLWQRAYALGVFPAASMPCPVISIGNIMAGGTGKTPMTFYLVRRLKAMGLRPVVISRGYGGTLKEAAAVVGDGESIFLDAEAAGDEPLMMAQRLGVPVVVGRDRRRAGQLAVETFNPDLLVMDDGFQHLKLKRDLDLVLLDHDRPFGNGRFLPAGRLRETAAMAARRAHGLILTRCPEGGGAVPPSIDTAFPGCPAFKTRHRSVLAAWIGGSDGGAVWRNSGADGPSWFRELPGTMPSGRAWPPWARMWWVTLNFRTIMGIKGLIFRPFRQRPTRPGQNW